MTGVERSSVTTAAGAMSYLAAGPEDGRLVVLVHGWPAAASTWMPQLAGLAERGYRVLAPDLRGYGESPVPEAVESYAQRELVADLRALLEQAGRESAVWVGHDWGSATVWALAAHHPQACDAAVSLVVPYRALERGYREMLPYVNREIYPAGTHPGAQFDYMAYYEEHADEAAAVLDSAPDRALVAFFRRGSAKAFGKPAPTATITRDGGWFGGAPTPPDLPREGFLLAEDTYRELTDSFGRNGFAGSLAYYRNHEANLAYSEESMDDGVLNLPVLFLHARYDAIADTVLSRLAEPMREHCWDLTELTFDTGHWLALERPAEVTAAIADWLADLAARRD